MGNFNGIAEWKERSTLHIADVLKRSKYKPDIRYAANFSWYVFTERSALLEYCKHVHADLQLDDIFVLDIYGGAKAMEEVEEERKMDGGITFIWDQVSYSPVT